MNIFKFNLNTILASLSKNLPATLNVKTRKDLQVWRNFLNHPTKWIPICPVKDDPSLATISFTTDAAGFSGNIGCGVLGTDMNEDTILGFQMWWPKEFITLATDNKGKRFGNKTTTLEMIALLLPLLLIPENLKNTHIRLFTDNQCLSGLSASRHPCAKKIILGSDDSRQLITRVDYHISGKPNLRQIPPSQDTESPSTMAPQPSGRLGITHEPPKTCNVNRTNDTLKYVPKNKIIPNNK
jgi:hypothetical protein